MRIPSGPQRNPFTLGSFQSLQFLPRILECLSFLPLVWITDNNSSTLLSAYRESGWIKCPQIPQVGGLSPDCWWITWLTKEVKHSRFECSCPFGSRAWKINPKWRYIQIKVLLCIAWMTKICFIHGKSLWNLYYNTNLLKDFWVFENILECYF